MNLLDELMDWLTQKEVKLLELEHENLPDDLEEICNLMTQHQGFLDSLTQKQVEVDTVCKPYRSKSTGRKPSKAGFKTG